MNRAHFVVRIVVLLLVSSFPALAQQAVLPESSAGNTAVPTLVQFSGTLTDGNGKPLTGVVGVTFLLYKDQQGGAPLWMEIQNVQAGKTGGYSVMLGATSSTGLPADLFAQGEARWLGVQAEGQEEQSRVMLLSVPYALKAGDAATLGGLPASAFVLAVPSASSSAGSAPNAPSTTNVPAASSAPPPPTSSNVTTNGGKPNTIPLFSTATDIENSILTQTGTAAINVGGRLNLPSTGTASALAGKNSQPHTLSASSFNSSTGTAVSQTFQWQAEPTGNNSATPSGALNLLFGSAGSKPAETGLNIASNGQITFSKGQTFPGTGTITGVTTANGSGLVGGATNGTVNLSLTNTCTSNQVLQWNGSAWNCSSAGAGTVTSVASGAGLVGGPITSTGTLSIAAGGVTNSMLANPALTIAAGTDLTGGGPVALGGSTTLNLDTTKIPQLATANTFSGNQSFTGTLNISSTSTYQPIQVQSSSTFGTWLELSNTSTGGQTWNILSAASGNAEGAGNLGITNLRGGKIWLEGPVSASRSMDVSGLQHTLIGDTGCGGAFGGIGFGAGALADCAHYSMLGEGVHTYLNRPTGGQILFREGNNTEMVLASGGNLGIGTTTPSFLLHVNGTMRAETGLSMGGNAVLSLDAPGVPNGRFLVNNSGVSIGLDTPMNSNPRMGFSGMFNGSLCFGRSPNCGWATGSPMGGFVPDRNIVITRITATINDAIDPSCLPGHVGLFQSVINGGSNPIVTVSLPANSNFLDSPIIPAVPITAGTQLLVGAELDNPFNCSVGASAGGNIWVNVQYVMQ